MQSTHFFRLLRRAVCVMTLFSAAEASANAFHVKLDTGSLTGNGWIDLQFNPGMDSAPQAQALLSGFNGALTNAVPPQLSGDASGVLPGTVIFHNSGFFNDLFQAVNFGGVFNFDLNFSGLFLNTISDIGSTFAIALYANDQITPLGNYGASGTLLRFELSPASSEGAGSVALVVADAHIASVSELPEPPAALLVLLGLMGMWLLPKARWMSR